MKHLKRCKFVLLEIFAEQTRHRAAAGGFVKVSYFFTKRSVFNGRDRQIFFFFDFSHLFKDFAFAMRTFAEMSFFYDSHTRRRFKRQ